MAQHWTITYPDNSESKQVPEFHAPRRETPAVFQVRVDLHRTKPPIWRRLRLRSDISLLRLHGILQTAFGWEDYHLWCFSLGHPYGRDSIRFSPALPFEDPWNDDLPLEGHTIDQLLVDVGDVAQYLYDFGDDWHLKIKLEKIEDLDENAELPVCTGGRGDAPGEDSGGVWMIGEDYEDKPESTVFSKDDINEEFRATY